jgi:hypothetical protein
MYITETLSVCILFTHADSDYVARAVKTIPEHANIHLFHHVIAQSNSVNFIEKKSSIHYYQLTTEELHFSVMRNLAKAEAKRRTEDSWMLMLDADERLLSHQHDDIYSVIQTLPQSVGGVFVNVASWSAGMYGQESASLTTRQCRLFRNIEQIRYDGRVHEICTESITNAGMTIADSGLFIHHEGYAVDSEAMKAKATRNLKLLETSVIENPRDERTAKYYELTKHLLTHF